MIPSILVNMLYAIPLMLTNEFITLFNIKGVLLLTGIQYLIESLILLGITLKVRKVTIKTEVSKLKLVNPKLGYKTYFFQVGIISITGSYLYNYFCMISVKNLTASTYSCISQLDVLFILIISVLVFKQKIPKAEKLSTIPLLLATFLLVYKDFTLNTYVLIGFVGSVNLAIYYCLRKQLNLKYKLDIGMLVQLSGVVSVIWLIIPNLNEIKNVFSLEVLPPVISMLGLKLIMGCITTSLECIVSEKYSAYVVSVGSFGFLIGTAFLSLIFKGETFPTYLYTPSLLLLIGVSTPYIYDKLTSETQLVEP